jgi:GNAT superfamily N-acetyltransferase
MTEIRHTTFSEVFNDPGFTALFEEYSEEAALSGLPQPNCQVQIYEQMEAAGLLHVLGAFKDGQLTGFLNLLVNVLPHYGVRVGTAESFFVAADQRKNGGGLGLLREAERAAAAQGAVGFLANAATGSRLAEVLPKAGYQESHRLFFRRLP